MKNSFISKMLIFLAMFSLPLASCNEGTPAISEPMQGEKGDKGDQGEPGPAGADGKDGANGKDGVSIVSITKTSSEGLVDKYTITYSDGGTSTFTVTNGANGSQGIQGEPGEDGHTPEITIGGNGHWFIDGVDSGVSAQGTQGPQGPAGQNGTNGTNGIDGKDGTSVLTGNGEPSINLGKLGDSYIDLDTWNYYVKENSGWSYKGNIKGSEGLTGPQGEQGPQGPAGQNGTNGTNGIDGKDGVSITSTYIDNNGDLIVTFSDGTTTNTGHVAEPTESYTVTFNSNGGSEVDSQEVNRGNLIPRPDNPNRDHYTFDGWHTDDGDRWNFKANLLYSDITLYAHWVANQYSITYHMNGGINDNANPDSYYSGTDTITLANPSKNYCTFIGWYSDPEFTTECNAITSTTSGNLHFYAKFEAIKYTYKFNTNGGTAIADAVGEYGSQFPSVSTTRDGYIFKGWYKDSAFNTSYTLPDTFPALNLTLYAKWEQTKYTVKIRASSNTNVCYISPEQSTTSAKSSVGSTFTRFSGQEFYVFYKGTMSSSITYRTVSPQINTVSVMIEFTELHSSGTSYFAKIYEYDATDVQIKSSSITLY